MSQFKHHFALIEKKSDLVGKILRPLSAKLLPETDYEKSGLVNRSKFFKIEGRQRKKQMNLAKEYKIKYPLSGGGCLLCDKNFSKKLNDLFDKNNKIAYEELELLNNSRLFRSHGKIFLGRNKIENDLIEEKNKILNYRLIPQTKNSPSAIFENSLDSDLVREIIKAYSSKKPELKKTFEKFRVS
jgi:tRNA-uridine 2-sulfurtransferase